MLSVITLTYQRHHILEEAMQSFLLQDVSDAEMVIVNDSPQVKYQFDHPQIKIINTEARFSTIGEKLEFGMKQCAGNYVMRIDDDDLLFRNALFIVNDFIKNNPGGDIYHPAQHHQFWNNVYLKTTDSINTGNVFSKEFIERVEFPKRNADEDDALIFHSGGTLIIIPTPVMIYRWNNSTYHISTHLHLPNEERLIGNPNIREDEIGIINLKPHFNENYWGNCYDR